MTLQDWFPVVTLVLGSILTLIGGLISDHYRTKASWKQAREESARQDNLARIAFQRDNILQLQDTGQELITLTLQCFIEKWPDDSQPTADPGQRQLRPISQQTGLARITARIQANKLTSRLPDQQDRKHIYELLDLSHEVVECNDFRAAREKLQKMEDKFKVANENILRPILQNTWVPSARS